MTSGVRSRFFEHGEVLLVGLDEERGHAALTVTIPAVLGQAAFPPVMAEGGILDQYSVADPLSVWIPSLTDGRIRPESLRQVSSAAVNAAARQRAAEALSAFSQLSAHVLDPSDLVPVLPLGVYVRFRVRGSVDGLLRAAHRLRSVPAAGMPDFARALSDVLSGIRRTA